MDASELTHPRYPQPKVLAVTRLRPEVLQTWVNRNAIELAHHNPGRGRGRLYSALDVVKLAIMRRMADFSISLAVSKEIAEAAAAELLTEGEMDWFLSITLRPGARGVDTSLQFDSARPGRGDLPLDKYGAVEGDWRHLSMFQLLEPSESMMQRRRKTVTEEGLEDHSIIPEHREYWARQGFHAEPLLFFPLGEIVNGTLAQLRAIDAGEA